MPFTYFIPVDLWPGTKLSISRMRTRNMHKAYWYTSLLESRRKKHTKKHTHIGFNTHFSPWSGSGYPLLGQTKWWWYHFWNCESYHSPYKETLEKGVSISERWFWIYEERCICICKGKNISMVNRILARYKKTSTWLHLLLRIRRINTFHQKLVALSPRSRG